jgi:tetratricopeptide (TPR) repeat protein
MRKELILLFLIISSSVTVLAQGNRYIDSLIIVDKTNTNDSLRFDALRRLAIAHSDSAYSVSLQYWNRAFDLAKRKRDKQRMGDVHHQIGFMLQRKGEFPEALEEYKAAIALYSIVGNVKCAAEVYNDKGLIYKSWGKYELALECFLTALTNFEEIEFTEGTAMAANNIGQIYYYRDEFQRAIEYFTRYLKASENAKTYRAVAGASNNIASAYMELNNFDLAFEYYFKAMQIYDSLGVRLGVAIINDNIGTLFTKQGQYNDALLYHFSALRIFNALDSKPRIGYVLKNIGYAYFKLKNYKQALSYYNESKIIAESLNQKETLKEIYYNLTDVFQALNRHSDALWAHKHYVQIKDSLLNIETSEKLTTLEVRYEADKKSRELNLMKAKLEQQKRLGLVISIIGILILFLAALVVRENTMKRKGLKAVQIQTIRLKQAVKSAVNGSYMKVSGLKKHFSEYYTIPEPNEENSLVPLLSLSKGRSTILFAFAPEEVAEENDIINLHCFRWINDIADNQQECKPTAIIEYVKANLENLDIEKGSPISKYQPSCLVYNNLSNEIYYQGASSFWHYNSVNGVINKRLVNPSFHQEFSIQVNKGDSLYLLMQPVRNDQLVDVCNGLEYKIDKTIEKLNTSSFEEQKIIMQNTFDFIQNAYGPNEGSQLIAIKI